MRTRILSAVVGVTLALAVAAPANAAVLFAVADNGSAQGIFEFDSTSPGSPKPFMPITGLQQQNERVHGIAFRPANSLLYAITNANALYTVNTATGAATPVGPISVPLSGNSFGVDFDPASDRLRVVSDADQNLTIDPANGIASVGSPLMYTGGSPNPFISGLAHSGGTYYGIDSGTDYLVVVDPSTGMVANRGQLGVSPGPLVGFDIVDGTGYFAALNHFHITNLSNGSSPSGGDFPMNFLVIDLAGMQPGGSGGPGPGPGPGPGTQPPLGPKSDFDLDGDVDAADLLIIRRLTADPSGVTVPVQAPDDLDGTTDQLDFQNWRMNFGQPAGGSAVVAQRRRHVALVKARRRVTLSAGQTKRVRLPLTKAGKRFLRAYKKKRLKVTMRFTVRHRPAAGAADQRTFKRKVTLRVKRTRR